MSLPHSLPRLFPILGLALALAVSPARVEAADDQLLGNEGPLAVEDFALLDHLGRFHQLTAYRDAPVIVLYVHGVACPVVRGAVPALRQLAADHAEAKVRFLLINASPQDSRAEIAAEAAKLGLELPVLVDEGQLIAEALRLRRTGEALVITTKDWKVAWRGPLDDRVGYGAQKAVASKTWLADALRAVLAGSAPPASAANELKGCLITFAKPVDKHPVDYARDVAPILKERCQQCHRAGGIAPWAMDSHKRVAGWSASIAENLRTQRMPPWPADQAYGTFANHSGLDTEERRTLMHWILQGAPLGAGGDPLTAALPVPKSEWPLGKPDLVIDLPEQAIPANGSIPYRRFDVATGLTQDTWIRAVDLRPSAPAVTHHGFAFVEGEEEDLDALPEAMGERARNLRRLAEQLRERGELPPELRQAVPRSGLTSFFASFVPGAEIQPFPKGTGKLLRKGARLNFQMHYTPNGEATSDKPRLGLYFHRSKPERELRVTSAFELRFSIPPQVREHKMTATRVFKQEVTLYAMSPHMHFRGSHMRFIAELPDGKREVLLSVPRYDLDWQLTYVLAKPRVLPAGTKVLCEGAFDNSPFNEDNPDPAKAVRFGEQTTDEMYIGYMVYTEK